MRIETLRRDLKAVDTIKKIIYELDVDVYLSDDNEIDLFNSLIDKIELGIKDELSIKELERLESMKKI